MSQKLLPNPFKWLEDTFQFTKDFVENYNEDSGEGCFLEFNVPYPKNLHKLNNNLPILPERTKTYKIETLDASLHDKEE